MGVSDIVPSSPMFGLFPRSTEALNWEALERPVIMPYLGKETEVESASQGRCCARSSAATSTRCTGASCTPPGHCWVQDGLYITCVTKKEARASENLKEVKEMDLELLQVCVHHDFNARGVSYMDEGDEQVCWVLCRDEVERLLHLPPHIFELLASHEDDEHSDRNMATHLVQFQRRCAAAPRNSTRAILRAQFSASHSDASPPSLAAPTSTCSCRRTRSSARRRT